MASASATAVLRDSRMPALAAPTASILLHVGGAVLALSIASRRLEPQSSTDVVTSPESARAEIDVVVEEPPPAVPLDEAETPRVATLSRGQATLRAVPTAEPSFVPEPAPAASSGWTMSFTTPAAAGSSGAIDLRWNHLVPLVSAEPAPSTSPPRERPPARPGLAESLATADARLGVGPFAPVVTALRRATLARVPSEGRAVLRVTYDSEGRVASVRLLSATGPTQAWSDAVAAASQSTPQASPSLAAATVDVRIDVTMVHGADSPTKPVDIRGESWAMSDPDYLRVVRNVAIAILSVTR